MSILKYTPMRAEVFRRGRIVKGWFCAMGEWGHMTCPILHSSKETAKNHCIRMNQNRPKKSKICGGCGGLRITIEGPCKRCGGNGVEK